MTAVDGAASSGQEALLPMLLKFTRGEQHIEVFSTELVRELIEFKWARYGQAIFLKETAAHILLVAAWSYTSLQDIRDTRTLFESSEPLAVMTAGTVSVLAGLLTEAALRRLLLWSLPLVLLLPVVAALLLTHSGVEWQLAVSLVALIALTTRSAMHEAWQLSACVLTVEEFDREFPEQRTPKSETEDSSIGIGDNGQASQLVEPKLPLVALLGQEFEALLNPDFDTGNEQVPAEVSHQAVVPAERPDEQEQPVDPELPLGWTGPHPVEYGDPGYDDRLEGTPEAKTKWFSYSKDEMVYERPVVEQREAMPDEEPEGESKGKEAPAAKDRSLHRRLQVNATTQLLVVSNNKCDCATCTAVPDGGTRVPRRPLELHRRAVAALRRHRRDSGACWCREWYHCSGLSGWDAAAVGACARCSAGHSSLSLCCQNVVLAHAVLTHARPCCQWCSCS